MPVGHGPGILTHVAPNLMIVARGADKEDQAAAA